MDTRCYFGQGWHVGTIVVENPTVCQENDGLSFSYWEQSLGMFDNLSTHSSTGVTHSMAWKIGTYFFNCSMSSTEDKWGNLKTILWILIKKMTMI